MAGRLDLRSRPIERPSLPTNTPDHEKQLLTASGLPSDRRGILHPIERPSLPAPTDPAEIFAGMLSLNLTAERLRPFERRERSHRHSLPVAGLSPSPTEGVAGILILNLTAERSRPIERPSLPTSTPTDHEKQLLTAGELSSDGSERSERPSLTTSTPTDHEKHSTAGELSSNGSERSERPSLTTSTSTDHEKQLSSAGELSSNGSERSKRPSLTTSTQTDHERQSNGSERSKRPSLTTSTSTDHEKQLPTAGELPSDRSERSRPIERPSLPANTLNLAERKHLTERCSLNLDELPHFIQEERLSLPVNQQLLQQYKDVVRGSLAVMLYTFMP